MWIDIASGGWWPLLSQCSVAGGWWAVVGGRCLAGGRWPVFGGRWPVAGGRWPKEMQLDRYKPLQLPSSWMLF